MGGGCWKAWSSTTRRQLRRLLRDRQCGEAAFVGAPRTSRPHSASAAAGAAIGSAAGSVVIGSDGTDMFSAVSETASSVADKSSRLSEKSRPRARSGSGGHGVCPLGKVSCLGKWGRRNVAGGANGLGTLADGNALRIHWQLVGGSWTHAAHGSVVKYQRWGNQWVIR